MGRVRKIGSDYFIEFEARGLKYQQKAGPDRAAAEALLKTIESKIAQGEMGAMTRDVELPLFWEDFLDFAKEQHTLPTIERYRQAIVSFQSFIDQKIPKVAKLSQITPSVVEHYKSYLAQQKTKRGAKVKPRLINFTILLLSDILQYGIKLGYIHDDPTLHVPPVALSINRWPEAWTEEQVEKLCVQFSPAGDILRFMAATGLDLKETAGLRWAQVELKEGIVLAGDKGRSGKYRNFRRVPLDAKNIERLRKIRPDAKDAAVFPQDQIQLLKKGEVFSRKVSGVARNTFAKSVLARGMRISGLYKLLGFGDIAMAERYSAYRQEYVRQLHLPC